jgi:hypothetical protein
MPMIVDFLSIALSAYNSSFEPVDQRYLSWFVRIMINPILKSGYSLPMVLESFLDCNQDSSVTKISNESVRIAYVLE